MKLFINPYYDDYEGTDLTTVRGNPRMIRQRRFYKRDAGRARRRDGKVLIRQQLQEA